jgi:hypothetical protein
VGLQQRAQQGLVVTLMIKRISGRRRGGHDRGSDASWA